MKWIEAKVNFRSDNNNLKGEKNIELREEVKENILESIKDVFYSFGLKELGFQDEENNVEEALINQKSFFWGSVIGYFIDNRYSDSKTKVLTEKLEEITNKRINKENKIKISAEYNKVEDKEWQNNWKDYFKPIKLSDNIVVKPVWEDYDVKKDELVVEIDPEESFGTGTHPTTSLCIEELINNINGGESFLDIGTGTGILMILAKKLGVSEVSGIDIDANIIKTAKKNLELNKIDNGKLYCGDIQNEIKEKTYDIVVANMLSNIILELCQDIKRVLKDTGKIIFSGILAEEEDVFISQLKKRGFEIIEIKKEEEWISVLGRLK